MTFALKVIIVLAVLLGVWFLFTQSSATIPVEGNQLSNSIFKSQPARVETSD